MPKASTLKPSPTTKSSAAAAKTKGSASAASKSASAPRAVAKKPSVSLGSSHHADAKAPSSRAESNGSAFKHFYLRNLKFCIPVSLVIAFLVFGGLFDTVSSLGKIHPGVKSYGVEVGGMSVDDAAAKINEELASTLDDARVTVYANANVAAADGASVYNASDEQPGGLVETASADELSGADVNEDGSKDKWTISTETLGANIDGQAMAEDAFLVGRQGNFVFDRIGAWLGSFNLEPKLAYNTDSVNDLCDEIDSSCGKKIKDSKITLSAGKASVVEGRDGLLVNSDTLCSDITYAFFHQEQSAITAPLQTVSMHVKPETAQRVADQVTAALADDVKITYNGESWTMDENSLGDMLDQTILKPGYYLNIGNGTQKKEKIPTDDAAKDFTLPFDVSAGTDADSGYVLQCYVNQKSFDAYLVDKLGDAATGGAKNARFDTSDGDTVKIIKSKNGNGPDRNAAELQLQSILFGNVTDRTIALTDTVIVPERTTEDAKAMGIKERLASWSIPLSGTSSRIKNIQLLCKLIDGSITAPGETWSFNDTTGERTADKGFEKAAVIVNGKHEDQLGGGVCQVATCVFNAACYSGLGIETRTNHDFYIPAYDDKGFADATVSWESPDLAWVNDTDNYILMTASAESGDVVVSLWGTKDGREVKCERGDWKAGTKYKTIKENDSELAKGTTKVEQAGVDGRSIKIHYLVTSSSGETLHDITFNSVYVPQNEIIKIGTKTTSSSDDSSKSDSSE